MLCGRVVEGRADLVVLLAGQGGRILLFVLLHDPGVGALLGHSCGLCLLVESRELRVAQTAGALPLTALCGLLAASSAGSFALRAEVTVVGVVLALVDGELLEKVVFQGVGVGRALGLGGVIVPADGVDGGLDGLVVVVEVQPADRQVGLVEEHELVAVAGLGLHGDPVDRVAVLGVARGLLADDVEVDAERAAGIVSWMFARKKTGGKSAELVDAAARDAYSRLIHPSLENELRGELSDAAAEGAIKVFGDNLRQLLLQPPIRGKTVMGLDPGYRMGCKVAVVDPTGKVLDTNVVYPVPEFKRVDQAKKTIKAMVLKNGVEVMAIGNGTAGHETEEFAAEVIRELADEKNLHLQYMVVSEAGASVYSASKLAAEEFPQFDVNLRSAVSIARRLQDPLAELVKIDPKAVGVGQYQHDMPQKRLNETLDGVVEDCVNSVGVDLNTASAPLLRRVAGVSAATAKNIVAWREEEGAFTSRAQLKKVKGLGPKAYEQCAGFLRLPEAKNRLDATAVHPESYAAAKALLDACGYTAAEIGTDKLADLPGVVRAKGAGTLCEALGVGEPTLNDIVAELCKPGRDVRDSLPKPLLRSDVMGLDDLKPGMELTGTVRNVIDFGAFVDLGVHQDGLVHVSQISDKFIKHPREVLKVGDIVRVKVLNVDTAKKRIALTMKGVPQQN